MHDTYTEMGMHTIFQALNPCQTWSDLINIYEFDNAITFKLKSILLFWYLDIFVEKDETGLLFQMNIT